MHMNADISYFARTNFRLQHKLFGIRQEDRAMHLYCLGQTGSGKTTMVETLLRQDIRHGRGVCYLEPHGDSVRNIYKRIPPKRRRDVVYLDLTNPNLKWRLNPLQNHEPDKRPLVASGLIHVFAHLFRSSWGDRIEHILRHVFLALLSYPYPTFHHILPMLHDEAFREKVLVHIRDPHVKRFWVHEYVKYKDGSIIPILNKVGTFLAYPVVRKLLISNKKDIDLRAIMDSRKILLVNLATGSIGEDASHLIGSLLITSLGLSAMTRVDIKPEYRIPYHIYSDEFQHFTGSNLAALLSEVRKMKVTFTLSHQYISQLEEGVLNALMGNVGTLVVFRVGGKDAPLIAREMAPKFSTEDVMKLPNYHIYLRLMIRGKPSDPFSAVTVPYADLPKKLTSHTV